MALTIAVGFVVDDAIVVVENIYRHVEAGTHAAAVGAQGRARDRLHRRVDQHFAGRGVHSAAADGRHRRPPVPRIRHHRDRRDRGVGRRLADADADAVLALPGARAREHHGRLYRAIEWGFDALLDGYRRGLDVVLRHQFATLMVFFATMALTGVLFVCIPKGFFPDPGHRPDPRHLGGRAGRLARPR